MLGLLVAPTFWTEAIERARLAGVRLSRGLKLTEEKKRTPTKKRESRFRLPLSY